MATVDTAVLVDRLVRLHDERLVLIRSSTKLLATGAPYPFDQVAHRLQAMNNEAWQTAGDLYRVGATDIAFNAVCSWTVIP